MDYAPFREIADEVGALLMVDMAHIAGLVAVDLHPSPVPLAEFVTSTTHKTLRGPRGGLILCQEPYAAAINEALQPSFRTYQQQVVTNAKAMGEELQRAGARLVGGGTDTHLLLVDLTPKGLTGKAVEQYLDEIRITVNKNAIPFDPQKPAVTSGIRIGTPAITSRGFNESEAREVGRIIGAALDDVATGTKKDALRARVAELAGSHDVP